MSKIHGIFNKKYTEKEFEKQILSNIDKSENKEFVNNLFEKDESGYYILKKEISDEEKKKLKKIKKVIKKNKAKIRKGRISFLLFIIIIVILFNIFLKNKLIEKSMEKALEISFQAKSEVNNVNFKILSGNLRFDKLTVANKREPMRNLFELGHTNIDISISQLLRKKFIIEDFTTNELQWNTERKTSGALLKPKKGAKKSKTKQAAEDFKNDITSILKNYEKQLKSPDIVKDINENISSINKKWSKDINTFTENIEQLKKSYKEVENINLDKLEKKENIQNTLNKINSFSKSISETKADLEKINENIKKDSSYISNVKDKINSAYENDIKLVKSKLSLPSKQNDGSIFSDILKDYAKMKLGKFYNYTTLFKQAVGKKKKPSKDTQKIAQRERLGYNVPFPAINYPKFWLQKFNFSLLEKNKDKNLSLEIKNLTDSHKVINNPTTFNFFQKERSNIINVRGAYDTREKINYNLNIQITAKNYPFSISDGVENQYIKGIKGKYDIDLSYLHKKDGKKEGSINIILKNLNLTANNQTGKIIKRIVENTNQILIKSSYTIDENENIDLSMRSDIDRKIQDSVKEYVKEELSRYEQMIKDEIQQKIDDQLKRNEKLISNFADIEKKISNNEELLNKYSNYTDQLKKEATKKLGGNLLDKIKDLF